jgi:hypothetical protein
MPTPRLERNLTASFASVDYRRKHSAGVMHTLGRDLPFARCESEFPRSFTEPLHTQSAAHSRLDAEAPRDRNAR